MSALKKIFGAGDSRDDEVLYQTEGSKTSPSAATATENVDRDIQSSRDIGTGAQNNPGITSKIGDTSNVQSQTAGTSSSSQAVTYASGAGSEGHGTAGRDTAIGTAGVAGATGATVYASDRIESDDRRDDVSKATYTERSYALSSDSTTKPTTSDIRTAKSAETARPDAGRTIGGATAYSDKPTTSDTGNAKSAETAGPDAGRTIEGETKYADDSSYNREAAAAGAAGVFGTTILGAGAYAAANRDNDQLTADTNARNITQPEAVDSSGRLQPDHIPGAFPTDDGADPHPNKADSSTLTGATAGGIAAGGAGGAAIAANDARQGYAPVERDRYVGRPEPGPAAAPPPRQSSLPAESTKPPQQDEQRYGRDAAIAGGVAAGAGAVGYGTYEATRDRDTATVGPHKSDIANKIDPRIQQEDPKQVKQVESHYGRDAAAVGATSAVGAGAGYAAASSDDNRVSTDSSGHSYLHKKSVEEPGEKKQGFFSKAFHGHRKEEEVAIGDSKPSNEVQRVAPAGAAPSGAVGSDRTPGLAHDDSGMITFHQEGTDPSAPALVIREKADGHEILRDPTK